MVKFSAGFALASALSLANAADFDVRVRNLAFQQPFSPILIVAHTQDVALFKEGLPASAQIQEMAEDGSNAGLLALAGTPEVSPFICGALAGDAPVFLGEDSTFRGTLEVDLDICPEPVFSMVSMLINTNDAFVGIDSERLGGFAKFYPPAFDAGTEANNEMCSSIPGPACPMESGNTSDGGGEGYIHVHRGFHGLVEGGLSAVGYDWRNPVAELVITPQ